MKLIRNRIFINFPLFLLIGLSHHQSNLEKNSKDTDSYIYYIDEICSYNYKSVDKTNPEVIICYCKDGFTTDKRKNITFGNFPLQCNYERKRNFIVFFFSIFLLFGFEYLYLERYFYFTLILIYIFFVIIMSCYFSIVSRHKKENDDRSKKAEILGKILPYTLLIWWIINNILIITGEITDGNGEKTLNDIHLLIKG